MCFAVQRKIRFFRKFEEYSEIINLVFKKLGYQSELINYLDFGIETAEGMGANKEVILLF